jgi:hypothetical protein
MFNIIVLDVVIGLVFVYLLYSMLATIIQEFLASSFSFRAKILERAINRMLEDENKFTSRIRGVFYLFKRTGNGSDDLSTTSFEFYNHPLIKFLGENKRSSKPGYINKGTFSKVLIDLLRGDQVKPGDNIKLLIQDALDKKTISGGAVKISDETLSYLKSIWADAQGDVEKFKEYLENWFDETMERATGWYKKHTQVILFFIGLVIAIVFNVDTIKIVGKLQKDPKLREQIVQQADAFLKAHPDLDKELLAQKAEYDSLLKNIKPGIPVADSIRKTKLKDSLDLVKYQTLTAMRDTLLHQADSLLNNDLKKTNGLLGAGLGSYECSFCDLGCFFKSLLGWIITALAISLGAPFWFDLLNKLMKLRNSATSSSSVDKQQEKDQQSPKIKRVG